MRHIFFSWPFYRVRSSWGARDARPPTRLADVGSLDEAPRAFQIFNARRQESFLQARCATSFSRGNSFVRARREPLDDEVNLADGAYRFSVPPSEVLRLKIINTKIYNTG